MTTNDATIDTSIDVALRLAGLATDAPTDADLTDQARPRNDAITSDVDGDGSDLPLDFSDDASWFSLAADAGDAEAVRRNDQLGPHVVTGPVRFGGDGMTPELVRSKRESMGRWWPAPEVAADARTFLYDEWDYLADRYVPAHCRIVEHQLAATELGFMTDVASRHAELRGQIRRQFALLRPRDRRRVHRCDDGDELDIDAIIEAVSDRRSGVLSDDRFHVRRDPTGRDVATAFLVDLSASTSSLAVAKAVDPESLIDSGYIEYASGFVEAANDSGEPDRRVIDIAKDAVALMCDALNQLGDQYAVYGFSGTGHDNVEFHVATEFCDRTDRLSFASIAAMEPRSYTRMGPAIRHATAKLAKQAAKTKLLIVISDGYPQDIDYGPNRGDKLYGLSDTASALREAADRDIATFAVTIDPAGHDYLRTMCPDNRYLVIDEVTSLPLELAKLYLNLAGGPEWRTSVEP
ncbi:MAG: VWA domain-containing protein [Acidimicrobiales bacterium]